MNPVSPDSVLTKRLDIVRCWNVASSKDSPSMLLTVKLLIDAESMVNVLNDPMLPWMLLTVIQDNSAQSPRSVLTVKSVMNPVSPDSVLTSRLDTARFCMVLPSKVKPSMELTVKLLMEAVSILNVLNIPKLP
jgi:hypothetical protein